MAADAPKFRTVPLGRHLFLILFSLVLFMVATLFAAGFGLGVEQARESAQWLLTGALGQTRAELDALRLPAEQQLRALGLLLEDGALSAQDADQLRTHLIPLLASHPDWIEIGLAEAGENGWMLYRDGSGWRTRLLSGAASPQLVSRWSSRNQHLGDVADKPVSLTESPASVAGWEIAARGKSAAEAPLRWVKADSFAGPPAAYATTGLRVEGEKWALFLALDLRKIDQVATARRGITETAPISGDDAANDLAAAAPDDGMKALLQEAAAEGPAPLTAVRHTGGGKATWYAFAAYPAPAMPLFTLAASVPEDLLLLQGQNQRAALIGIAVAGVLLALLLVWWLGHSYTRTIHAFLDRLADPRFLRAEHGYLPRTRVRELALLGAALDDLCRDAALARVPEATIVPETPATHGKPAPEPAVADTPPADAEEPPEAILLDDDQASLLAATRKRLAEEAMRLATEKMEAATAQKRLAGEIEQLAASRLELERDKERLAIERKVMADERETLARDSLALAHERERLDHRDAISTQDSPAAEEERRQWEIERQVLERTIADLRQLIDERPVPAAAAPAEDLFALERRALALQEEREAFKQEKDHFARDRARLVAREEELEKDRKAIAADWDAFQHDKANVARLKETLETQQRALAEREAVLGQQGAAVSLLEEDHAAIAGERARLQQRLQDTETMAARLQDRELAHQMEQDRLDTERHALETERGQWMDAKAQLDLERDRLAHEREELASKVVDLMQRREEMTFQNDQIAAERDQLDEDRALLQERVREIEDASQDLRNRETALSTGLDDIRRQQAEVNALRDALDALHQELEAGRGKLAEEKNSLDREKTALDDLRHALAGLEADALLRTQLLDAREDGLESQRQELEYARAQSAARDSEWNARAAALEERANELAAEFQRVAAEDRRLADAEAARQSAEHTLAAREAALWEEESRIAEDRLSTEAARLELHAQREQFELVQAGHSCQLARLEEDREALKRQADQLAQAQDALEISRRELEDKTPPEAYRQALDATRRENRRLRDELADLNTELSRLAEALHAREHRLDTYRGVFAEIPAIRQVKPPRETLREAVSAAAKALGCEYGALWIADEHFAQLACDVVCAGTGAAGAILQREHALMLFMALESEPLVVVRNAATDPRIRGCTAFGVPAGGAVLLAPLQARDRIEAVIVFARAGGTPAWYPEEESFVLALAQSLATVIVAPPSSLPVPSAPHAVQEHFGESPHYRYLLESTGAIVWALNRDGQITFVNPAAEEAYGYPVNAMLGRPIGQFGHGDAGRVDIETMRNVLDGLPARSYQNTHQRSDGAVLPLLINLAALQEESGDVVGVVALAHEMSDAPQDVDVVARPNSEFEDLSEVVWTVDVAGIILHVNNAVQTVYGYEPRELIGQSIMMLSDPKQARQDIARLNEAISAKSCHGYVVTHKRKDGEAVHLLVLGEPLRDESGCVTGVKGLAIDLSRRRLKVKTR